MNGLLCKLAPPSLAVIFAACGDECTALSNDVSALAQRTPSDTESVDWEIVAVVTTVVGTVTVPEGVTCTLDGTRLKGWIKVGINAHRE